MRKIFEKSIITSACILFLFPTMQLDAQTSNVEDYNRSSIYTISLLHPGSKYVDDIFETLLQMESPEKYNDHNLSVRIMAAPSKQSKKEDIANIESFLQKNLVAKRLVSKWFNRDKSDGSFDMSLIMERGNYNATVEDVEQAKQSIRGTSILADAGEQLINNTFVIVNDIDYVNKEEKAQMVAAVFSFLGEVASAVAESSEGNAGNIANLVKSSSQLGKDISDMIAGFTVEIKSYLFKLKWDDQIANTFYKQYFFSKDNPNAQKKIAYEKDNTTFTLEYVGEYTAKSAKTVMRGIHDEKDVFMKVLSRATDENIVKLQKAYPVFKVTATINDIADNTVKVNIGLKEGVNPNSKYEVLERIIDNEGRITYRKKGIIKPNPKLIWDNRYMAAEERADNAGLNYTTFNIVSGTGFYPGMLIHEIK